MSKREGARNKLLEVRRDGTPIAVAFVDEQARFWAYAPETQQFHRNEALFRDFFADERQLEYAAIDPGTAQRLAERGVGASHPRMLPAVKQQPSMSIEAVLAKASGDSGQRSPTVSPEADHPPFRHHHRVDRVRSVMEAGS